MEVVREFERPGAEVLFEQDLLIGERVEALRKDFPVGEVFVKLSESVLV